MGDHRKFNDECLAAHNGLRKAHKVGALVYDDKLAKAAQQYAEVIAKSQKLAHSSDAERPNIGENLAFCNKPFVNYMYSGRGASSSWYSEIKDYDFSKEQQEPNNPATGHFTQLIWKDSKQAGFGRAQDSNKSWYVVARYAPAGNYLGNFMNNVPKCCYSKWEDVPVIQEYLEELRTWEFTKARKHILDDWSSETKGTSKGGVKSFTLTENFKSDIYGNYSEVATFSEDPSDLPRPKYEGKDSGEYDADDDPNNDGSDDFHPQDEDKESFPNSVLRQHNHYRKKHNVTPLKIDQELSDLAQDWAEELVERKKTDFSGYTYQSEDVGENITKKEEDINSKTGERLVDNWYEEQKFYSYKGEPENFSKVGHFTQVVWKETSKIGIGFAKSSGGQCFIVCFYHPAGNTKTEFGKNVIPPVR